MKDFYEELKKHLDTHSKEEIEAEWDKTKHLDDVGITFTEFKEGVKKGRLYAIYGKTGNTNSI